MTIGVVNQKCNNAEKWACIGLNHKNSKKGFERGGVIGSGKHVECTKAEINVLLLVGILRQSFGKCVDLTNNA